LTVTGIQAPLWAFSGEAVDGLGDTHLPAGIHVRALPSPRLGIPATPLVVTRSVLSPGAIKEQGRTDGVIWIDSHGATLTLPFAITPDNPVYGYFPVPNVIFAELTATAAQPTVPTTPTLPTLPTLPRLPSTPALVQDLESVLRAPRPIAAEPAPGPSSGLIDSGTLEQLRDVIDAHAITLATTSSSGIRFEALANSALGLGSFQARQTPPYTLAAWTIPLVRVIGRGTVLGIQWLDASRLRPTDEAFWELWSLPVDHPLPRYTPPANARAAAMDRVTRAGAIRQPMYVAYTAASPAAAPPAAPGDAAARIGQ